MFLKHLNKDIRDVKTFKQRHTRPHSYANRVRPLHYKLTFTLIFGNKSMSSI